MRRMIRSAIACLLVLAGMMVAPLAQPVSVLAADATVTTCDENNFDAALAAVQGSGGGTITFACGGTILFSGQKTIGSNITIAGGGSVTLDGQDTTRLFRVNLGASLSLDGLTLQNGNSHALNGGAILNDGGTLTVTASTFSSNRADNSGAAIFTSNVATVIASTFTGNTTSSDGGAIHNAGRLTITASTFSGNTSASGGAIGNVASLTVTASTFSGNTSTSFGGAITSTGNGTLTVAASAFSGNGAGISGGAIYTTDNGALTVTASTLSGNSAGFSGGAIYYNGSQTLAVTASTLSGNLAGFSGGAIHNDNGTLMITASTLSGNIASLANGAMIFNSGTARVQSTILANSPIGPNCSGSITSFGYNISDDTSCSLTNTGDQQGAAATINLGPLQDNGGPTDTMLPLPGSDAIGAIPQADCLTYSTSPDQRGLPRPQGDCEIGAVELGLEPTIAPSPSQEGQSVALNATFLAPGEPAGFNCRLNWGDGVSEFGGVAIDNGIGTCTGNHVYSDNDTYSVTVEVCDGATCDVGSTEHTVTNVAPTITGIGAPPVAEGSPTTITVTATDPAGVNDPLQYAFDCDNDGNDYETAGTGNQGQCTFGDNGSFTVGVQVSDDDGGSETTTTMVEVLNVAPTVNAPSVNPSSTDEGQSVVASATFSDTGTLDTHTCTVDYGAGDGAQVGTVAGNLCTGPAYAYADDGDFTVTVTVTDDDTGIGSNTVSHSVNNLDPTITDVVNGGSIDEGGTVMITVTATDPGVSDVLTYNFDCDNSGDYETAGAGNQGACSFADEGDYTVGVQVEDGDGGSDTDATIVSVLNVAPSVETPAVDPSPSNEGQSVVASATFSDPGTLDTHTCTVDYGDGSGVQAGTVVGLACTGPLHTYLDDNPSGTASDDYTITVTVTDDDLGVDANGTLQNVSNLPPVITQIATNAPVPQGQPATITVVATDAGGAGDPLTYAFDCDNDGSYETAGNGSQGSCSLDPAAASTTIGVQVSDDDLGVTSGSIVVSQTLTLCGSSYTGAFSAPLANGACPSGTSQLTLPLASPVTICLNRHTGGLRWSPAGSCAPDEQVHIVPDSGPLHYCQNVYTRTLRYAPTGQCTATERAGVIPG